MTQDERRLYLINELLKERNEDCEIPDDEKSQKDLLRSLMNIRQPLPVSADFLQIQDDYLQEVNRDRGCTDVCDLESVKEIVGSSPTITQVASTTMTQVASPTMTKDVIPVLDTGISKKLYLWQGDITTLKVDAIVNAANSQLLGCFAPLHACIDNCIHTFAGIQLRLACNELMKKQGHEEGTGLCKITPAFNLPSRYVLHTVGPIIYTSVGPREKLLLENCYKNCLETASQNQLESVAFCCISTGVFRFPQDLAAQIAVETVEMWLAENPESTVKKVIFNVFGNKDLEIYKKVLGQK